MAAYGKGQMLGSGINPESFKQDYSGFSRAAEIQAQGLQNLGQSIGGAIQNFGEAKKEQKKVDAYNKASAKSIEAAITLGKSYEIKGVEETLAPFLESYNDPNLSPIEKAALLDEGKAMIPNVFGRFDKSQAMAIQNAQNAPPPAPSFGFTGTELKKTDRGDIYVLKGNDGRDYDPETKLPISNLGNFGKGLPPEAWSDGATSAADFIDGALNIPFPIADGSPGSLPPVGDVNPLLPPLTPKDAAAINAILAGGQLAPPVGEPPASIARPQQESQYTPRYIATDEAEAKEGTIMTQEELDNLVERGESVESQPLGGGKYFVKTSRLNNKLSAAELKLDYLEKAATAYAAGDKPKALRLATAAGIGGLFGNLTISDLDEYFESGVAPPDSAEPIAPSPVTPTTPPTRRPIDQLIPIPK